MKRILVVDDDDPIRKMLVRLLTLAGPELKVDDADDGTSALERLAADAYDLVIVDHMMPDLSGIEVIQKLRAGESNKDVPVIMLTARLEHEHVMESLKSGADYFVAKPFEPQDLLEKVGEVLGVTL